MSVQRVRIALAALKNDRAALTQEIVDSAVADATEGLAPKSGNFHGLCYGRDNAPKALRQLYEHAINVCLMAWRAPKEEKAEKAEFAIQEVTTYFTAYFAAAQQKAAASKEKAAATRAATQEERAAEESAKAAQVTTLQARIAELESTAFTVDGLIAAIKAGNKAALAAGKRIAKALPQ